MYTVFIDKAIKARAAGAAVEPQDHRVPCSVPFRDNEVVVQVLGALLIDGQVSTYIPTFKYLNQTDHHDMKEEELAEFQVLSRFTNYPP